MAFFQTPQSCTAVSFIMIMFYDYPPISYCQEDSLLHRSFHLLHYQVHVWSSFPLGCGSLPVGKSISITIISEPHLSLASLNGRETPNKVLPRIHIWFEGLFNTVQDRVVSLKYGLRPTSAQHDIKVRGFLRSSLKKPERHCKRMPGLVAPSTARLLTPTLVGPFFHDFQPSFLMNSSKRNSFVFATMLYPEAMKRGQEAPFLRKLRQSTLHFRIGGRSITLVSR